jgi:hypothetical protein
MHSIPLTMVMLPCPSPHPSPRSSPAIVLSEGGVVQVPWRRKALVQL